MLQAWCSPQELEHWGCGGKKVEWERANKDKNIIYMNVHPAIVTSVSKKHQFNNINPHESHIDS